MYLAIIILPLLGSIVFEFFVLELRDLINNSLFYFFIDILLDILEALNSGETSDVDNDMINKIKKNRKIFCSN